MLQNIKWFREISAKDAAIAGSKGCHLGELSNEGFNVPPGFIITTQAYFNFLKQNALIEKIGQKILETNEDNLEEVSNCSEQIKNWINNAMLDSFFEKEIKVSYMKLGEKKIAFATSAEEDFVAVRSSPTMEELLFSFTGEKNSSINVRGKDEVIQAVKQCWASLFNAKTIPIIKHNSIPISKIGNAVIIQKMINSEFSGTMFTINPETGDNLLIEIEIVHGLRIPLADNELSPDVYLIDKKTLKLAEDPKIAFQDWMLGRSDFGTEKLPVARNKRDKQKLLEKTILDLGRTARQVEQHYKKPQEIEFAMENNKLYIVQTRSIAYLRKKEPSKEEIPAANPEAMGQTMQEMAKKENTENLIQNQLIENPQPVIQPMPKNFDSFIDLTKLKYSMLPLGENEFNALVQEIAEKMETHENQAIKTLATSIKENKYNKQVLEVLIKDLFEIIEKEIK